MSTREMAHKILDSMNEEQLIGFISLFKFYNISVEDDDLAERERAYDNLRKRIKPVTNLDYDKELSEYREEKYGV
ncbi:MAG: UDP-N-acetylenolpyruvoylglucosamine reductase [Lachnospiraceae bacterium]|nr:UDP-N-acetylenolpyruvoylglucosamine reductase [Lachnospiraceae bacterium]